MQKKILIHSLTFSPDGSSTAYLYNDIATELRNSGYEVVVLTTTPHYNIVEEQVAKQPLTKKCLGLYSISSYNGIKVYHVLEKKYKNTFLRLICFSMWHIISFIIGLSIKKIDIILSPSPPITIGVINVWLTKIKHCKVVYNVQEIYPDILEIKNKPLLSILKSIERYVYNNSDAVTTIDDVFYNTIVDRFKDKNKLKIIPNFVDTNVYRPIPHNEIKLNESLFPKTDSLKLVYAGNIGFAQDWDTFFELADKKFTRRVDFYIIGNGVTKSIVEEKIQKLHLNTVHLIPYQSRNLMPDVLAFSDIQFIFMTHDMEMQGFPSKVYTIMACGKPLLISSGVGTPLENFFKDHSCAKLETENDVNKRIDDMANWINTVSNEELRKMGEEGLSIIKSGFTREAVTKRYVDLMDSLL